MKKTLIVLALLASFQVADAQSNVNSAAKAVESALAASQNEKKATKVATWMKLAQAYVDAYGAPAGNVWLGADMTSLQLSMGNEKPSAVEMVTLNGAQYTKQVYENKNLYFNANGQLSVIEVVKPVVDNALPKALEAYKKAYELDEKHSKDKDISAGIKAIAEKLNQEAYNSYTLGDVKKAEEYFEAAYEASAQKPCSQIDTNSLYNAAFTSWSIENFSKAKAMFDKCLGYGYYGDNGEVFAKLSDCVSHIDTTAAGKAAAKDYLEQGFQKYPTSESIVFGLINYYMTSGEGTDRLFELLQQAKTTSPDNASLYYVEGQAYKQIGDLDKAAKAYDESAAKDPNYVFAYIGKGQMYYDKALELQEKAQNELDDAKYMALTQEFEVTLKKCIDPFEQAYVVCQDPAIKSTIAEYLKQIYYRFRDQDPQYQAGYEKYNAFLNN
ncbi:MAG TPA: hypothetical protein DDX40_06285 [Rikenellaceae bacterium]|nr:hypothetical protein [Rikenellaceae bacterium]